MNSRLAGSPRKTTSSQLGREARVLHADVVLVGEEVRHAVVGDVAAEHRAGGRGPLVERVGPVLDADVLARRTDARRWRRRRPRTRPGRWSAGRSSTTIPLSIFRPASVGQLGARRDADPDDDEVALDRAPVAGADPLARRRRPRRPRRRCRAAARRRGRRGRRGRPAPTSGPSTRSSGTAAGSMTVTSAPRWRADAATSAPIQPAPMTTTLPPASRRPRSASQSASVRR